MMGPDYVISPRMRPCRSKVSQTSAISRSQAADVTWSTVRSFDPNWSIIVMVACSAVSPRLDLLSDDLSDVFCAAATLAWVCTEYRVCFWLSTRLARAHQERTPDTWSSKRWEGEKHAAKTFCLNYTLIPLLKKLV